jgi:ElaB/YqjD/DUF883 family membrane-anchored ribosome-binding protein
MESNQPTQVQPNLFGSAPLLRLAGYLLLLLSLIDIITIVFPPMLMNPVWEFQTIGAIVERLPVPILGLVLVFYGELNLRARWEPLLLKALSWLCLLLGVLMLLLVPLGARDAIRINVQNNAQVNSLYNQQTDRFAQFEQELNQASSDDINAFLASQGVTLEDGSQNSKEQLLAKLTEAKQQLRTQFEQEQANRRTALLKNAVKWNLGAFLGGVFLMYIWHMTRWARSTVRKAKRSKKPAAI